MTRFGRSIVVSVVLSLGVSTSGHPKNVWIERFRDNDQLASLSISSIVQDKVGFLWFGTQGGLIRYDGSSFLLFEHDPFDRNSLSHNLIQTMHLDPDGVLWIGSYHGLSRFDPNTDSFLNYSHEFGDPRSLSNDVVVSITSGVDGTLWVGTLGGLNHFDPDTGRFTRYYASPDDETTLSDNVIRSLLLDSKDRLWVGSYGGLDLYDRENNSFRRITGGSAAETAATTLPSLLVMTMFEERADVLWIGTWGGGLSRFDVASGRFETYELPDDRVYAINGDSEKEIWVATWGGGLIRFDRETLRSESFRFDDRKKDSISHNVVYSLRYDASGILWIGTNGGGLCRFDPRKDDFLRFRHDSTDPESLSYGKINSMHEDRYGVLWFGIYNGGLDRYDAESNRMIHYREDPEDPTSLPNDTVVSIYEDREGELWITTLAGLARYDRDGDRFDVMVHRKGDPESLSDNLIYALLQDATGDYWIGTYNNGVDRYDRSTGSFAHYPNSPDDLDSLSDNLVYSLLEDLSGNVWIGTNMGLNRYDPQTDGFVRYLHDPDNLSSLSSNTIRTLFEDSAGRLWIGTTGGGLNRYHPETDDFSHHTRVDGLSANTVMSILEDDSGRLWVATTAGITILDPETIAVVTVIDETDGLLDTLFNSGHLKDSSGALHFGTIAGVCVFEELDATKNTHVPNVVITNIMVFNDPVDFGRPVYDLQEIEISFSDRFISFEFAALDYASPDRNQYAYRLDGFDPEWIQAGTRNYASYTNLAPGEYVLRVKGSNGDRIWNETGVNLTITITPPFWRTPWAYASYLLMAAAILYLLVRLRSSFLLRRQVVELETTKTMLEQSNAELVRTNQELDDFAYIASHDLKEPLRGISTFSSFLLEDHGAKLDHDGREKINTLIRLATRMTGLIDSLLDYSRIGRQELEIGVIKTRPMIDDVIDSLSTLIGERETRIDIDPKLPDLLGDPTFVYAVFYNLISNAIKYNRSTPAIISIMRSETPRHGYVTIAIRDNGIGIPEKHRDYVFRIFKRLHERDAFGSGTGAGLTIAKKSIERLGGSIGFESIEGEGTTFHITLKAATDGAP